jgi:hypothetical protein
MDGGYKAFYEKYSQLCTPQTYITMWDDTFKGITHSDISYFKGKKFVRDL